MFRCGEDDFLTKTTIERYYLKTHFSRAEAAQYLGLSSQTLADWACKGVGPVYSKLGHARRSRVLYAKDDLDRFISLWKNNTVQMNRM